MRIHADPALIEPEIDRQLTVELLARTKAAAPTTYDEREIVSVVGTPLPPDRTFDSTTVELTRGKLLGLLPERFEHLVKELLVSSGFERVAVTRFSQDGGIDVNAYTGCTMWPLKDLLVQIQAKRWLHTVGRKEVAELRGSLLPHARGALVTTSYFSKAALLEAAESGKLPIVLVDGNEVARLSLEFGSKT